MAPPRNRRPGFSRRAQYGLFFGYVVMVAGSIVAIILLLLSTYNPTAFSGLRGGVREVTTPFSTSLAWASNAARSIPTAIGDHIETAHQNARLRAELLAQNTVIQRARMLGRENARLRRLLDLRDRGEQAVVSARLVSSSASSTRRYAVLNAGWRQGVRPSQPVRGPLGLIGRVMETGPDTARIMLLTDPESIVPVRRTRDGMPATVAGRGDGLVDIRAASLSNAPLLPGDVFVTSGTGGVYPPDIPVARIVQSGRDTARGRIFADPDTLDFATVERIFMPTGDTGTQATPATDAAPDAAAP